MPRDLTPVAPPAVDLARRANLTEWMDEPCSFETFRSCLQSLARLNRLTLAYRPTLDFLARVVARKPLSRPLQILDVGSGYGDMLRRIHRWATQRRIPVQLTGIDLNPYAARAAREVTQTDAITYLTGDAFTYPGTPDLIVSSLLMHHLATPDIPPFLSWMEATSRLGWFVNDLHRQPIPYRFYGPLTKLLRFHPFVHHDGLISFRRAFRHEDWEAYLSAAQIAPGNARIVTYQPARLCVERIR